jgi:enterochelin esterase-like enzyme
VSSVAGELVTETLGFAGGRLVTAYVPPNPPNAIVFAADGQRTASWGRLLEAADLHSTMIVGAHSPADETQRLHEYSPVFDPEVFARHEAFFVGDVADWVRSRFEVALPPDRTAIFGASAGGELALALGLRHPQIYGSVLCASPGAGFQPGAPLPTQVLRAYLVAGTLEPFFRDNAARWADALRNAGAEVVMRERVGTHGDSLWRAEFPSMVAWAFHSQSRP